MTFKTESRVAIIVCYPLDWHWVLSMEAAELLRGENCKIQIIDFSNVGENIVRTYARKIFRKKYLGNTLKDNIDISYRALNPINYLECRIRQRKMVKKLPRIIDESTFEFREIYPTLVELTGKITIPSNDHKQLIRQEISKFIGISKRCENLNKNAFDLIVTVNGRFTKNYTLTSHFRNLGVTVKLLEFGSNKEKLQIYDISPHSMKERMLLMQKLQESAPPTLVRQIGDDYIKSLRAFDPWAAHSWTSKMARGLIPEEWKEKKICTFFSSSQREFVGVQDEIEGNKFKNQVEAFSCLVQSLDPNEWNLILRRHPRKAAGQSDDEDAIWKECLEFSNVHEVGPESEIDSYELGECSEIVAHFNSSIGPELIFRGHKRVITLGPTMWQYLSPESHLPDLTSLNSYLQKPRDVTSGLDLSPWGYYLKSFGSDFSYFHWSASLKRWVH